MCQNVLSFWLNMNKKTSKCTKKHFHFDPWTLYVAPSSPRRALITNKPIFSIADLAQLVGSGPAKNFANLGE